MTSRFAPLIAVLCLAANPGVHAQIPDGPFLGQGDPPAVPALFAPGIVNLGLATRDVAMTPAGDEIYFGVSVGEFVLSTVLVSRRLESGWTRPEVASFAADPRYKVMEPCISPDGALLFFASDRPRDGDGPVRPDHDIWFAERGPGGWGEPRPVPGGVNSEAPDFYPSVARNGTLYFTRDDTTTGVSELRRATRTGGVWNESERLPDALQLGRSRFNAWVDPDERFLIVPAYGMPDTRGGTDYYLVRRLGDGWSAPANLGDAVNTADRSEYSACLSPDGRALFFMSARNDLTARAPRPLTLEALRSLNNAPGNGRSAIWWVDAGFLKELAQ
jgi:hypothetical protein